MQQYEGDNPATPIEPYDEERMHLLAGEPGRHVRVFSSMSKACAAKRVAKRRMRNKRARKARKQGRK